MPWQRKYYEQIQTSKNAAEWPHLYFVLLQWKEAPVDSLMDSKLKCVFEMATDSVSTSTESTCILTEKEDVKKRDVFSVSIRRVRDLRGRYITQCGY